MDHSALSLVETVFTCTENNVITWPVNVYVDVTLVSKDIVVIKVWTRKSNMIDNFDISLRDKTILHLQNRGTHVITNLYVHSPGLFTKFHLKSKITQKCCYHFIHNQYNIKMIVFYIRQCSSFNFNIRDTTICGSFRLCYIFSPECFRKWVFYHEVTV